MNWQTVSVLVGFIVLYTKVIFDYASIKSDMSGVREVLTELKVMLSKYDKRIDDLEHRLTIMETKCNQKGGH